MDMRVSDVAACLLEGVAPAFAAHGFDLKRKARCFARDAGNSTQIFSFGFVGHPDRVTVKPEVMIKVHRVEEIYRAATSVAGRPLYTLGNHLLQILRYVDEGAELEGEEAVGDWLVQEQSHVDKLIAVIPEYFKEVALPYCNENSSVHRADRLLNKHPRKLSVHNSLYPLRANLAIIAARLNANNAYEQLVDIYEEELTDAEPSYKEEFARLKSMLSEGDF